MKTTNSFLFRAKVAPNEWMKTRKKNNLTSKGIIHTHRDHLMIAQQSNVERQKTYARNLSLSIAFHSNLCLLAILLLLSLPVTVKCVRVYEYEVRKKSDLHLVILYENFLWTKRVRVKMAKMVAIFLDEPWFFCFSFAVCQRCCSCHALDTHLLAHFTNVCVSYPEGKFHATLTTKIISVNLFALLAIN